MTDLSWNQVLAWRLERQFLSKRARVRGWQDVVARIGGLHAQLLSSAALSLWARVEDLPSDLVHNAIWNDRQLVKMWAMRGTLHLMPTAEYRLWQTGLATYKHFLTPHWLKYFGVTVDELDALTQAISESLLDRTLTRMELSAEVTRITGSEELGSKINQSWGSLLKPACFRGHLCFAPGAGNLVKFTNPRSWIGLPDHQPEPVAAMPEITRRYLGAYGPATAQDLAHWWGMTPRAATLLLDGLAPEAVPVHIEGQKAWMLRRHVKAAEKASTDRVVTLLPAFDPWIIAFSPHVGKIMAGDNRKLVFRQSAWISPVVLVNGRMEAVWEHERKGRKLLVQIRPFRKLTKWAQTGVGREAERLKAFLGGDLQIVWHEPSGA